MKGYSLYQYVSSCGKSSIHFGSIKAMTKSAERKGDDIAYAFRKNYNGFNRLINSEGILL